MKNKNFNVRIKYVIRDIFSRKCAASARHVFEEEKQDPGFFIVRT